MVVPGKELGHAASKHPITLSFSPSDLGARPRARSVPGGRDRLADGRRGLASTSTCCAKCGNGSAMRRWIEEVRDTLDGVEHVVQRRGEPMDVLAVEGGDERGVDQRDDLMRQVIAFVLEVPDPLRMTFGVGKSSIRTRDLPAPAARVGGPVEQVEERELAWDDLERHRTPSLPAHGGAKVQGGRSRCPPGEGGERPGSRRTCIRIPGRSRDATGGGAPIRSCVGPSSRGHRVSWCRRSSRSPTPLR